MYVYITYICVLLIDIQTSLKKVLLLNIKAVFGFCLSSHSVKTFQKL